MGCFLGCFGSSKDRRRRKQRHKVQPRDQQRTPSFNVQSAVSLAEEPLAPSITPVANVPDVKPEEQLTSGTRKKVTFDTAVTEYEHVLAEEVTALSKQGEDCDKKEEKAGSESQSSSSQSSSDHSSITSSLNSYPPNHRYNNCRESDDELDCEECDIDEEDGSDGAFSDDDFYEDAHDESRSKSPGSQLVEENVESLVGEVVNEPVGSRQVARDKSLYTQTVLIPVENTAQWKALKAKKTPQVKLQKENAFLDHEPSIPFSSNEPSFKEVSSRSKSIPEHESKRSGREVAVDASLSTWLSSEETSPVKKSSSSFAFGTPDKSVSQGSNSLVSLEDRPILGALTLEEIRQFSATSSPRRSPSRSPDEMPIIGTVGSYWSQSSSTKDSGSATSFKGIPNTTSKYREDKKVKWHSTPFETRLERALNRRAAGASYSSVGLH